MVARGDLGVEIGDAELPGLQKKIIRESLAQNKVVITATQMLQSMVESPIPTRAEVLDVANAVIDGTDAVMLSAETAAGAYPVRAVEAMARICLGAEHQFEFDTDFEAAQRNLQRADQAIAMATMFLSEHIGLGGVVALTESGGTPRFLSRFRSNMPIYAFTRHDGARRQMAMMRGVFPINFDSRGLTRAKPHVRRSVCWWRTSAWARATAWCLPAASTWKRTAPPTRCVCWKWATTAALPVWASCNVR